MRIDDRMEALVRATLDAVVARDPVRLQQALGAFPDDDTTTAGYRLAATVALVVLEDQLGHRPDPAEVRQAAEAFVARNDWTDITVPEIVAFVSAVHHQQRVDRVMTVERAILISYALAGDVLNAHHRPDEQWWDYLNRIEAALEAAV